MSEGRGREDMFLELWLWNSKFITCVLDEGEGLL